MPERITFAKVVERHDVVTLERAAQIYGATRTTIENLLKGGKLAGEKIGERYFVNRLELETLARTRAARTGNLLERSLRRIRPTTTASR
jgi:hypothetical protein